MELDDVCVCVCGSTDYLPADLSRNAVVRV